LCARLRVINSWHSLFFFPSFQDATVAAVVPKEEEEEAAVLVSESASAVSSKAMAQSGEVEVPVLSTPTEASISVQRK